MFTLGRIVNLVLWVSLAYLFLAFPGDTIRSARDRRIFAVLGTATIAAWAATVAVSDQLPAGGHFVNCVGACPANGLQVATVPGDVAAVFRITASAAAVLLILSTAAILVLRMRAGGRLQRRVLAAPLATMTLIAIGSAVGTVLRESNASAGLVDAVSAFGRVGSLLLPLGFLAGLVMGRVFVSETTTRLITELSTGSPSPARARDLLARALEQPSLRLAFWLPERGEYLDTAGVALPASLELPGRSVTAIQRAGQPYAVVVHESALPEERDVVELAGSSSDLALENMRLEAELNASIGDLRASRARLVAVADGERRRVERDLHDGAQHRLIALRVKLRLLEEADEAEVETRARLVHELEADAEAALEDLRSLVRGIYPPLLVDRGLSDALDWATRSAPIQTTVNVDDLRRYAPEVEAAVYFCCLEALQNAAKHAGRRSSGERQRPRGRHRPGVRCLRRRGGLPVCGRGGVARTDEHARSRRRRGRNARRHQRARSRHARARRRAQPSRPWRRHEHRGHRGRRRLPDARRDPERPGVRAGCHRHRGVRRR